MKFIKKVFIFLLTTVILILQFDMITFATEEYTFDVNSITKRYFECQDYKGKARTLWIGYDSYANGLKCKYYNPYGGTYLTINGSKYDEFGGQVDINDPESIRCLGENCWDHVIITIELGEEFLDNKCLDALFSLLKENGTITVPIWQYQFKLLEDKEVNFEKNQELKTLEKNLFSAHYEFGGTAFMHGQLKPINVKEAIKILYQCNSDFVVRNCCTAVDCKRERGCFFLGDLGEYEGLFPIRPRYIVTLQKQTV